MGQGSSQEDAWKVLLQRTSVQQVLEGRKELHESGRLTRPNKLIQLKSTDTLHHALTVFKENDILAAPVWSDSAKGDMGFFDVMDAVAFLAQGAPQREGNWELSPKAFEHRIGDVVNFSRRDAVVEIAPDATLQNLLELMTKSHAHRVAVLDGSGSRVADIITQTDIIRWLCLHAHEPWFYSKARQSLHELGMAKKRTLYLCTPNDLTLWAYSQIAQHGVSALGVVDETGKLVGALSSAQLRGMSPEECADLALPVKAFLEKRKIMSLNYCVPSTLFVDALRLMNSQHIHRLFVVDEKNTEPVGVLTLSDIIKALTKA